MFDEDPEASKLSQLPGVEELLNAYRESFNKVCVNLFEFGLKDRLKRNEEIDAFFQALEDAVQQNLQQSLRPIEDFEKEKAKVSFFLIRFVCNTVREETFGHIRKSFSLFLLLLLIYLFEVDYGKVTYCTYIKNQQSIIVGKFYRYIHI